MWASLLAEHAELELLRNGSRDGRSTNEPLRSRKSPAKLVAQPPLNGIPDWRDPKNYSHIRNYQAHFYTLVFTEMRAIADYKANACDETLSAWTLAEAQKRQFRKYCWTKGRQFRVKIDYVKDQAARLSIPPQGVMAFLDHRRSAHVRDIPFLFDLEMWWNWWQQDGRWSQRGRKGKTCLLMGRHNDSGPYAPWNVSAVTAMDNATERDRVRNLKLAEIANFVKWVHAESGETHIRERARLLMQGVGLTAQPTRKRPKDENEFRPRVPGSRKPHQ